MCATQIKVVLKFWFTEAADEETSEQAQKKSLSKPPPLPPKVSTAITDRSN